MKILATLLATIACALPAICSVRRNREELSPPAASRRRRWVAICPVGHECFAVSEPLYLQRVRCSVEQVQ